MQRKIKLNRGKLANLPQLDLGEPAVATDDGSLFIGTEQGNVKLAKDDEVQGISQQLAETKETLSEKISRNETGSLNLNIFDETSRAVLQGLEPGQVNAVLGEGNVRPENTDFLGYRKVLTNFYDSSKIEEGGYYGSATGTWTETPTVSSSHLIPVKGGDTVTFMSPLGGTRHITFWNDAGAFVRGHYPNMEVGVPISYVAPENATGVRVAVRETEISIFVVNINEQGIIADIFLKPEVSISKQLQNEGIGKYIGEKEIKPENTTFFELPPSRNLFDKTNTITGGFYRYSDGLFIQSGTASSSQFIPVEQGDVLRFKSISPGNYHITLWNDKKEYLKGFSVPLELGQVHSLTIDDPNVAFFVTAYRNVELNEFMIVKNIPYPDEYVPYTEKTGTLSTTISIENHLKGSGINNPWKGKKVVFQGDSITDPNYGDYTDRWPQIVAQELGLTIMGNYAKSGSTIAINPENTTGRNPIVARYESMTNDAELVLLAAGTNDFQYSWSPIGDMSSRDNQTLYGALHNLCLGLKKKYPRSIIVFMKPIMRAQAAYNRPDSTNVHGLTLKEYGDIIEEVCRFYSIPVIDMYSESGLYPYDEELATLFIPDKTHPNGEGQKKMARRVAGFLRQLI